MNTRSKTLSNALAPVFSLAFAALPVSAQSVHYVDSGARGVTHDGKSWCTAFVTLQDALAAAAPYDTIRVAQGIYTPDQGSGQTPGDGAATFEIVTPLGIYGGFAGCGAPNPSDRDIEMYETLLSGDLESDDDLGPIDEFVACYRGPYAIRPPECAPFDYDGDYRVDSDDAELLFAAMNYGDNSYHVVTCSGWDARALLDGFTITSGNAGRRGTGAGVLSSRSRIRVNNCTFVANVANNGAALHIYMGDVQVSGCTFRWNAAYAGGALYGFHFGGYVTIAHCAFHSNAGGGMRIRDGKPFVSNCTFTHNTASFGAGLYSLASKSTVENCVFIDNAAYIGGAMVITGDSTSVVSDCRFSGNVASDGGGALRNLSNTILRRCTFDRNAAVESGGAVDNGAGAVAIACTFVGNTARNGGAIHNSYSDLQSTNCVFNGNAANLGGAVYLWKSSASAANCTFSANEAGRGAAIWSDGSESAIANSILWNDRPDEVFSPTQLVVAFSNVQGGLPAGTIDGGGNVDADPLFLDAVGADGMPGTPDDDLRVAPGSPCIDAADNWAVGPDVGDLDGDRDEDERTPLDRDGRPRFVDDPATRNTGVAEPPGCPSVVDMGAYEFFSICGNGIGEPGEICDGMDNDACVEQPCRRNCTCAPLTCGNGVRDPGEACDGRNDDLCRGLGCRPDCTCTLPKPQRPTPKDLARSRLRERPL